MANEQNLIPAKKGEIRNPNGRPKGALSRSTIIKRWIEAKLDDDHLFVDMMTKAVMEKAMNGDVQAFKELMDSAYGKVTDKQELTNPDGSLSPKDITVKIVK